MALFCLNLVLVVFLEAFVTFEKWNLDPWKAKIPVQGPIFNKNFLLGNCQIFAVEVEFKSQEPKNSWKKESLKIQAYMK